ncbi:MAG: trigger factor [Acutalibacteraceae bacterium]|jgi:trigger factor
MKKFIRTLAVVLAAFMIMAVFASCGKGKQFLYSKVDLSKYVKLDEYKNLPVDSVSDTILGYIEDMAATDASEHDLYDQLTEGKVQDGDIANIDYEGKKDGVAFEGGTSQGYDLEIGSGTFIPGFEEGLIGAKIGSTVDLPLTFPSDYGNKELAGAAVVFTVKVNSVKRHKAPKDMYSSLGFKSVEAYEKDLKMRAIKQYLLDTVLANSKITDYPKEDLDYLYENERKRFENDIINQYSQYNIKFSDYLEAMGYTEEQFETEFLENKIKPMMKDQMPVYYIAKTEGIEISNKDIDDKIKEYVKSIGRDDVKADDVREYYGNYYFEQIVLTEKVMDFLYENAKIK